MISFPSFLIWAYQNHCFNKITSHTFYYDFNIMRRSKWSAWGVRLKSWSRGHILVVYPVLSNDILELLSIILNHVMSTNNMTKQCEESHSGGTREEQVYVVDMISPNHIQTEGTGIHIGFVMPSCASQGIPGNPCVWIPVPPICVEMRRQVHTWFMCPSSFSCFCPCMRWIPCLVLCPPYYNFKNIITQNWVYQMKPNQNEQTAPLYMWQKGVGGALLISVLLYLSLHCIGRWREKL